MTRLGTKMKLGGYASHQVGKWDEGMATPQHTPVGCGFESFFGYLQHSNNYYSEVMGT